MQAVSRYTAPAGAMMLLRHIDGEAMPGQSWIHVLRGSLQQKIRRIFVILRTRSFADIFRRQLYLIDD